MNSKTQPYAAHKRHSKYKSTERVKIKIVGNNTGQMKGNIDILIAEKVDVKTKTLLGKEGHFIIVKGSAYQKAFTILNLHVCDSIALKYVKQK